MSRKKLKPFFVLSSLAVPLTSIMIIESIKHSIIPLIQLAFLLWGIGMMVMRVCSLPFIIRNTTSEKHQVLEQFVETLREIPPQVGEKNIKKMHLTPVLADPPRALNGIAQKLLRTL